MGLTAAIIMTRSERGGDDRSFNLKNWVVNCRQSVTDKQTGCWDTKSKLSRTILIEFMLTSSAPAPAERVRLKKNGEAHEMRHENGMREAKRGKIAKNGARSRE